MINLRNSKHRSIAVSFGIMIGLIALSLAGCENTPDPTTKTEPAPEEQTFPTFTEQLAACRAGQTHTIFIREPLDPEQIKCLSEVKNELTRLEILWVGFPVEELQILPELTELQRLRIESTVDDEAMSGIIQCKKLKVLNLPHGSMSDQALEGISGLEQLELLRIGSPAISDAGLSSIAQLPQLRFLHLIGTPITDAGLEKLQSRTNLESLYLDQTKVTDNGLRKLLQALPELHLHRDQLHLPDDPRGGDHH